MAGTTGFLLKLDDEARAKLDALAAKSGRTRTATLRQLIMGRPLGDRTRRLTLAKLNQLGGILSHCAKAMDVSGLLTVGEHIRSIAIGMARGDSDEETAADDNL